jgi:hypothetical protein
MRSTRSPGSLVALTVLVGVMMVVPTANAAGNTWAGTWDSDFGKLTLDAGGSGSYDGSTDGTVSGHVTGNVDEGTWTQPGNPTLEGTFKFTLSGDGQTFTGDWAYKSGGCGMGCGWNGRCISGACLMNGTQKPPNPCGGVSSFARSAAADCPTRTLTEPIAGGIAKVSSPTLGRGASKLGITVRSTGGKLTETTIVAEGEVRRGDRIGEAVAACWLIGPEALDYGSPGLKANFLRHFKQTFVEADAAKSLDLCIVLVRELAKSLVRRMDDPARSAASTCQAKRLGIAMRVRKGRIVAARPVTSQRLPSTAVRYRCAKGADGAVKVTVDGRRRGGLRKKLGLKLALGIVRAPNAPAARGKLTLGFGAP